MTNHGNNSTNRIRHHDLWAMIAAFRAGIGAWIPLGYQDETGFHYGLEPIASILERLVDSRPSAGHSSFGC
jgi:hypothetical protein